MVGRVKRSLFLLIALALLHELMQDPHLKIALWRVVKDLTFVVLDAPLGEVSLHEIKEAIVLLLVHPWVFYDEQSIGFQSLGHLLAVLLPAH